AWTGKVLATAEKVPTTKLEGLTTKDEQLRFTLKIVGGPTFDFEGKLPKAGSKNILGTFATGRRLVQVQLEATSAKSFDPEDINRDIVAGQGTEPRFFEAAAELLFKATERKAKPEDVRGWAEKAYKAAEAYGARWQREIA